ncbi:hypothetical protein COU17_03425 [Candidatus Kaiserbacteria bacterium CG10_big_fil_rev_8_21_14_0_10_49_17]|uniref:TrbC/VIRB2 family protein n=1 Tax=Candidatus Kaiserbacteria bacterium CG10_big_fil_rev_8_21_14_0_10_49_17 TaxID=1974609 RepID=A0A2M6WDJ4_9BACT|nr:MAG: hypothetical protein COU17_03425 [Candidatus Kaiserbacteria bacterium CG10_big_fil_rev_8_21_14_0_10_49_17]
MKLFRSIAITAGSSLVLLVPFLAGAATENVTGGSPGGGLQNPLSGVSTIPQFINVLLDAIIVIGLPIAALFIIYAGFLFVTAQGSEEKLKNAKSTFLWTLVGIAVFIGAKVIAELIDTTIKSIR